MVATSTTDREAAAELDATTPVAALQLKIRLLSLSPMVWRRVLVAESMTLRELHGVFQVAMGWQSRRLFLFERRAVSWGSIDLDAASPDVTLVSLELRRGAKLVYRYDMIDDWAHEVRVEERLDPPPPRKRLPLCLGGAGACPPEGCGGTTGYLEHRSEALGFEAFADLTLIAEVARRVLEGDRERMLDDEERMDLEDVLDRLQARRPFLATGFSRRTVNKALRANAHLDRMHQWF